MGDKTPQGSVQISEKQAALEAGERTEAWLQKPVCVLKGLQDRRWLVGNMQVSPA